MHTCTKPVHVAATVPFKGTLPYYKIKIENYYASILRSSLMDMTRLISSIDVIALIILILA